MRVLLVAADAALGGTLARGLLEHGVDVAMEQTAAAAKERAFREVFDVLVIDGSVPGGAEVGRGFRRLGVAIPTIMLIDPDSVADRVRARAAEADAFVNKPVGLAELMIQVRAVRASRAVYVPPDQVSVADLVIDLRAHRVYRGKNRIELSTKEAALLEILARRSGRLVDRTTISEYVWGADRPGSANVLEVLVRRLRRKIDNGRQGSLIETCRGRGYRLGADREDENAAITHG
jgi:two-component system copper resistance phosphate regulon response regulator CusR